MQFLDAAFQLPRGSLKTIKGPRLSTCTPFRPPPFRRPSASLQNFLLPGQRYTMVLMQMGPTLPKRPGSENRAPCSASAGCLEGGPDKGNQESWKDMVVGLSSLDLGESRIWQDQWALISSCFPFAQWIASNAT